jgi:hypothetical protein
MGSTTWETQGWDHHYRDSMGDRMQHISLNYSESWRSRSDLGLSTKESSLVYLASGTARLIFTHL